MAAAVQQQHNAVKMHFGTFGVPFPMLGVPFPKPGVPFPMSDVPFSMPGIPFPMPGVPFLIHHPGPYQKAHHHWGQHRTWAPTRTLDYMHHKA